jgi:transcriptional regulator of acetoin/glycerol metabolism
MRRSRFRQWAEFGEHVSDGNPRREVIIRSWTRCEQAGVGWNGRSPLLRRISDDELQIRLQANRTLIHVARPHLRRASASLSSISHVIYLVDAEGIVLESVGNSAEMTVFGLMPGYDWSETQMGTNGAGTALKENRPVAIVGFEHYSAPFKDCTCTAAPIRSRDGEVIGALDISTSAADGQPSHLVLATKVAERIEAELWRPVVPAMETTAAFDAGSVKVLCVDDHHAQRYVLAKMLRRHGMSVLEARNATEMASMLRERPDVVILDVHLPDGNGIDLCRLLKADPATAGIPIIQTSAAYTTAEDSAAGLEAGADAYLAQPVDPQTLISAVAAAIQSRRITPATETITPV